MSAECKMHIINKFWLILEPDVTLLQTQAVNIIGDLPR